MSLKTQPNAPVVKPPDLCQSELLGVEAGRKVYNEKEKKKLRISRLSLANANWYVLYFAKNTTFASPHLLSLIPPPSASLG